MDQGADHPNVVVAPPLLVLGALAAAFVVDAGWPAPFLGGGMQYALGGAVFALGLGIVATAIREFRRVGTNVPTFRPTLALASGGPYRFTRNPIYVGLCLGHLGVALAGDSLWAVAAVIPVALVLHYGVVLREEAFLEGKFGEPYTRYRAATRRWLW